ncbi:MAG TPA: tetratricopeptide repeat protein [Hyphomonadaceae bacterium]|nr:tetratricopeptide repeat protein [Hyphomonadaceae bacterium]
MAIRGLLTGVVALLAAPALAQELPDKLHLYDEGVHALDAQNFQVAESNFKAALTENPRDVFSLMMLGILEVARNDYPDAKKHFELAAKIRPKAPDPVGRLGWVLAKMGDKQGAKHQRALLTDMNQSCKRLHCLNADAIANGILMIDSVLTDDSADDNRYGAGVDAIQAKDWDKAEAAFRDVLNEAPNNPGANFLFGVVRIGQDNLPEAKTYLEKAVKLSPRLADPIGRLGWVYVQLGDIPAAKRQREKLETMQRDCEKICFDRVTIDRGLWIINGVLPEQDQKVAPKPAG